MKQPLRSIAVIYNHSESLTKGEASDIIAEQGVILTNEAINKALSSLGYRTASFAVNRETILALPKDLQTFKADLVFNLCETFQGESRMEMHIPSFLEMLGFPYTGSNSFTLGVCLDKFKTKILLAAFGLPAPRGHLVEPGGTLTKLGRLSYPVIVKPNFEDGSLGITNDSVVHGQAQLQERIEYIHGKYRQAALIEDYIEGREINVSIVGNKIGLKTPRALPLSEIDFSTLPSRMPKICGYHSKWLEETAEYCGTKPICPALMNTSLRRKIERLALKAYEILGCRDYARVDLRLNSDGFPFILEVNPNPDLAPNAGLARSSEAEGMSYSNLIDTIVSEAWQRIESMKTGRKHG